jgi:uncharacterized protein
MNHCQAAKCTYCCEQTNMLLTPQDIARIEALGHARATFSKQGSLGIQLKNTQGHCVFLRAGHCQIYDARPIGCRLYPVVYEQTSGEAILDDACPRHTDFQLTPETRKQLKTLLACLFPDGI